MSSTAPLSATEQYAAMPKKPDVAATSARRPVATGQCLCGAVSFEIFGPMRNVVACHCKQCRRWHGHYAAYTRVAFDDLAFVRDRGLQWYSSSESARRGFCRDCGSSLFWRPAGSLNISVCAGSLDPPTGLTQIGHIFCDSQSDYYRISDGLLKYPSTSHGAFDDDLAGDPPSKHSR